MKQSIKGMDIIVLYKVHFRKKYCLIGMKINDDEIQSPPIQINDDNDVIIIIKIIIMIIIKKL